MEIHECVIQLKGIKDDKLAYKRKNQERQPWFFFVGGENHQEQIDHTCKRNTMLDARPTPARRFIYLENQTALIPCQNSQLVCVDDL